MITELFPRSTDGSDKCRFAWADLMKTRLMSALTGQLHFPALCGRGRRERGVGYIPLLSGARCLQRAATLSENKMVTKTSGACFVAVNTMFIRELIP